MGFASRLRSGLRNLLRKQHVEEELDAEVRAYVDLLTDEKIASGADPEEARRAARAECGGAEQVKQSVRDSRAGVAIETVWQDVRYALRGFRRNPIFASSVITILALGLGSTTAVFSVVDRILFRSLPYADSSHIVSVGLVQSLEREEFMLGSFFYQWRDSQKPFWAMASQGANPHACDLVRNTPVELDCIPVQAGFLPMLGISPVLGRNFLPAEDRPDGPPVALISWNVWRNQFGGNPGIVNHLIDIEGNQVRVVGVLPRYFQLPTLQHADIYLPMALDEAAQRRARVGQPMRTFARLKPGVSVAEARAEMEPLFRSTQQTVIPASVRDDFRLSVRSLRRREMEGVTLPAWLLLAAVMSMLLIACANVASLMMARAAARSHETAVRAALGAGRARLVRQSLTEALLLALLGTGAGLALASILLRIFVRLAPIGIPYIGRVHLDLRIVAFALVLALSCAILAGIVPAIDRPNQLSAGARTFGPAHHAILRRVLVVGQIATSLVLLAGAALLVRSFTRIESQRLGMRTHHLVAATIVLPWSRYKTPQKKEQFYLQTEEAVRRLPGIRAVAWTDSLPPGGWADNRRMSDIGIAGKPPEKMPGRIVARHVTPGYFRALDIPILSGRAFQQADRDSGQPMVVINRLLADRLFSNSDPIGQHIQTMPGDPWYQIVGVSADSKNNGLADPTEPEMDFLILNTDADWGRKIPVGEDMSGGAPMLVIDSVLPPATVASWVQSQVHHIDPTVPVKTDTVAQRLNDLVVRPRFETALLTFFACAGLLLAVIGLYGVTAYLATQRTREIGVRIAVGATRIDILRLILAEALRLVLIGCFIGLVLAVSFSRFLKSLLYHVSPHDPAIFAVVTAILGCSALIAAVIPARFAMRVDPVDALRSE